jgi:uncharacterized protein
MEQRRPHKEQRDDSQGTYGADEDAECSKLQDAVRAAAMNCSRALELLTHVKPLLMERYGVTRLALFGSTVRDAARSDSDIDILVAFAGPATSERYFGVQFCLEDLFGCPIDLVTEQVLRAELRPQIEQEAVHV